MAVFLEHGLIVGAMNPQRMENTLENIEWLLRLGV
jgi:hypothetical protein